MMNVEMMKNFMLLRHDLPSFGSELHIHQIHYYILYLLTQNQNHNHNHSIININIICFTNQPSKKLHSREC